MYHSPSPFYPFLSKFFFKVEVFCDNISPTKRGCHLGGLPGVLQPINFLGQIFLSILWRCPKDLKLHLQISSGKLIMPSFLWRSCVLIRCSSQTPQIQLTTPLSTERLVNSTVAGYVSQPYKKIFLTLELNILRPIP